MQKKGDVTSAVASVKAEDFTAGKIGDAAELIKGKVAGLTIAHYSGEFKDKEYYRQKLAGTYGKERQLISGIHFNFSFSEKLMDG